jgi:hypothetical protein
VDALHEAMKMHAQLALAGQRMKEEVHQVGLAAPDSTPQVQTLHRLTARRQKAGQQTLPALARPLPCQQAAKAALERIHRNLLLRIGADGATPEITLVQGPGTRQG